MKSPVKALCAASVMLMLAASAFAQSDTMGMMTPAVHVAEHMTLGAYLVDAHGRTLYAVVNGEEAVPCDGECAKAWPPFTIEGENAMADGDMMAGESSEAESKSGDAAGMGEGEKAMGGDMMASVDPALIGTVMRADGTTQMTYGGHPLYYFVGDVNPGEVKCQAVEQFGGTWYVLSPSGDVITTKVN